MTDNQAVIDFGRMGETLFIGRKNGEVWREKKNLDHLDGQDCQILVTVPPEVMSINSSFFLGMFGPSIKKAGTLDEFLNKYRFDCDASMAKLIKKHTIRGLQEQGSLL